MESLLRLWILHHFFLVVFGNKKIWECFYKASLTVFCICVLKSFEFDASKTRDKSRSFFSNGMRQPRHNYKWVFLKLHVVDNSFPERHVVLFCVIESCVDFFFFWLNYKLCLLILSRIQLILVFFFWVINFGPVNFFCVQCTFISFFQILIKCQFRDINGNPFKVRLWTVYLA